MEVEAFGQTEIGRVRADNQDALSSAGNLYAVADGMGGYEHGGLASTGALESFVAAVNTLHTNGDIPQAMRRGVQDANLRVYQESVRLKARMGTTLTGVYLDGATLHIAHVGDSRAYLIRKGMATCLTNDHTGVGEMVRARVLSPDKVRGHAQRSVLNRCLGMELFIQADISRATLQSGDVIVLCSDGLWSAIEDEQIAAIVSREKDGQPQRITDALIQSALEHDSDDNISAWAICVRQVPDALPEKRRGLAGLFRGRFNTNS